VSQRGSIMVATQRIHVGMIHARKVVTVTAGDHSFQISLDSETIAVLTSAPEPRSSRRATSCSRSPKSNTSDSSP
jgi:hypothetical protein